MVNYSVDLCHEQVMETRKPLLAFDEHSDYRTWREQVRARLVEALGDMPKKTDDNLRIEWEKDQGSFVEYRFHFTAEALVEVPCHLWVPKDVKKPCPVVICLQGHSTGMHISMGRPVYAGDENLILG